MEFANTKNPHPNPLPAYREREPEPISLAVLISVPFGILAAVFLAEFSPKSTTASAVRFVAKVLSGLPSVLAGLFAYAAVVILTGHYSAPAGGIALAILMLPTRNNVLVKQCEWR